MVGGGRKRKPGGRAWRPGFEPLEGRALLSGLHPMGRTPYGPHQAVPALNLVVASRLPLDSPTPVPRQLAARPPGTPRWVNTAYIDSLASQLYAPITTTQPITVDGQTFPPGVYATPQPTPRELRRETFWATYTGRYSVGPPRFSNQAATIHVYSAGRNVVSNWFLNGRGQFILFPPADPAAQPTTNDPVAGQISGIMSFIPANALQTSDEIIFDLNNLPGVASSAPGTLEHGLPAHFGFTLDTTGAGAFTTPAYATTPSELIDPATGQPVPLEGGAGGAVAFTQGMGRVDVKYHPDGRLRAGASQSGTVVVRVQGLLNYSGTLNSIYKGIN